MSGTRPKIGDIVEVPTSGGLGYVQFTFRDPQMGALVRVLPGLFAERPNELQALAEKRETYFVYIPLGPAVARGLMRIVEHGRVPPGADRPRRMKSKRQLAPGVVSWLILEEGGERSTRELAPDERGLSPYAIWNDTLLAERMVSGWLPEDEV